MGFNYSDEIWSASTLLSPAPASLIRFLSKAPLSWVRQKALSNQQYFRAWLWPLQDKRCKCNQLLVTGHEPKSAQQKHQAAGKRMQDALWASAKLTGSSTEWGWQGPGRVHALYATRYTAPVLKTPGSCFGTNSRSHISKGSVAGWGTSNGLTDCFQRASTCSSLTLSRNPVRMKFCPELHSPHCFAHHFCRSAMNLPQGLPSHIQKVMAALEEILDMLWAGEREGLGWIALLCASTLCRGAVVLYIWGRKTNAWRNLGMQ